MVCFILLLISQSPDSLTDSLIINGRDGFMYQAKYLHYGNAPLGFYPYSIRHNSLNFQVDGQLSNGMKVEGDFSESDHPNTQTRGLVKATTEDYGFAVGDIALPGIFLQKSIIGLYSHGKYQNFTGSGFYSAPKGHIKHEEFNGNLTQGPFYLSYTPIVHSSEMVWIRRGEVRQQQTRGNDYEVDYRGGNITFLTRIIEKEEIVEIIYETSHIDFLNPFYGVRLGIEHKGIDAGISHQVHDTLKITGCDFGVTYDGANLRGNFRKMGGVDSKRISGEFAKENYWINSSYENSDLVFSGLERKIFQQESGDINSGMKLGSFDVSGGAQFRTPPDTTMNGRAYRYHFNSIFQKDRKKVSYLYEHSKNQEFGLENSHTIEGEYAILHLLYGHRVNNLYVSDRMGIGIRRFEFKRINCSGKFEQEYHNKEWFKTNYKISSGLNYEKIRTDFSYYRYLSIDDKSDILNALATLKPIQRVKIDGRYRIETRNTFLSQKMAYHTGKAGIQINPIKSITLSVSTHIRKNYMDMFKQLDYIQHIYGFEFRKQRGNCLGVLRNSRTQAFSIRNLQEKTADDKGKTIELLSALRITENISIAPHYKREENIGLGFFVSPGDTTDTTSIKRKEIKTERNINSEIVLRERTQLFSSIFYNSYYNFLADTSLYDHKTLGLDTKLSETISDFFIISALFGFSKRTGADPFLSKTDPNLIFYTISPGIGAKLNIKNLAIIESEYRIDQAVGETTMRFDELKLTIRGNSKNLTGGGGFTLRQGHNPDYGISEISCNLTLKL
jgi:hypothetical protein